MVNNPGNIFFLLLSLMGWKIRKRRRRKLLCLFGGGAASECERREHGRFHSLLHGCVTACCGGGTGLLSQDNVCMFTCCPPFVLSINLLSCFSGSYRKLPHAAILPNPLSCPVSSTHRFPSSVPAEGLETLSNVRKCIQPSVVIRPYQVMLLDSTKCWCSTLPSDVARQYQVLVLMLDGKCLPTTRL